MNILIVEARYHPAVSDALVDGATAALDKSDVRFARISVPGALEIPPAIAQAQRVRPFDGYVALGSVVQDGGFHFEIIAREAAAGLMRLACDCALCIGNGIVVAGSETQALFMAQQGDAGGDAARACLALVTLKDRLS